MLKTGSEGELEWNRTYDAPGWDEARSVVQTRDGGYALAGTRWYDGAREDFWLLKTDSRGELEWNRSYGTSEEEIGYSVIQTRHGGYALAGVTGYPDGRDSCFLVKTDSQGELEWNKTYGGRDLDKACSVIETRDQGYALGAWTKSYGSGDFDFWLVKIDSEGELEWNKTYGGPGHDEALCLIEAKDGGFVLAGVTESYGAGKEDCWLVKTSSQGDMEWNMTCGGSGDDGVASVVRTKDGGYALAGWTDSYGVGSRDFWLVKIGGEDDGLLLVLVAGFGMSIALVAFCLLSARRRITDSHGP